MSILILQKDEHSNFTERVELTRTEKVLGEIRECYKNAELSSTPYKAFADHTDYLRLQYIAQKSPNDFAAQMRYALIDETVRQHRNELTGYKTEYRNAGKLQDKLQEAVSIQKREGGKVPVVHVELGYIKNEIIDRKNNPNPQQK